MNLNFFCGEEVWFRNRDKKVVSGELSRVCLILEKFENRHYSLEAEYEDYDLYHNDGRKRKCGAYLSHSKDKKTVFHTLEELQEYEKLYR